VLDYATGKSSQSEVSQLLSSRPELVTLVGTPEDSAKILRAAFQAGYEGKLVRHAGQPNAGALELTDDRVADRILDPVEADSPAATEAGCVEEGTTVLMVEQGDSCVRSRPPSPVSSR
jgi:neutral amino acid transport system substrate-binding protein